MVFRYPMVTIYREGLPRKAPSIPARPGRWYRWRPRPDT